MLIKHMFVLTNKVQPILYFSRIIKLNTTIYLNLIKKPNVLDLKECTQLWPYVILFWFDSMKKKKKFLVKHSPQSPPSSTKDIITLFHLQSWNKKYSSTSKLWSNLYYNQFGYTKYSTITWQSIWPKNLNFFFQ